MLINGYEEKLCDNVSWACHAVTSGEFDEYCREILENAPEELVRDCLKDYDLVVPRWLEIRWLTPKIIEQLNRGHAVTLTPRRGSGLLWSCTDPTKKRQTKHKTPWLATEPKS
ncbi:hypothetical protein [Desulfolutivibrio sulfoxidireducens]|uniref:hypothetical protein n=1 Tax=Desulfolutivibrio sulfoxidireducens TaxID=2773299 RepID=UPI00159D61E6|nr:hypothetical protein [Desulfolutivibrio sulfoxidireducens]QLA16370.1 hypothetical protein GD605_09685 [Desulfolutivibrio sulfoxidireducens]